MCCREKLHCTQRGVYGVNIGDHLRQTYLQENIGDHLRQAFFLVDYDECEVYP